MTEENHSISVAIDIDMENDACRYDPARALTYIFQRITNDIIDVWEQTGAFEATQFETSAKDGNGNVVARSIIIMNPLPPEYPEYDA